MTWQTDPDEGSVWAVQGAKSGARMARLQLQGATRGEQGAIEISDLQVRSTTIPSGDVTVSAGGCVVLGREQQFQGSYYGYNVGLDTVSVAPTGSGGGRADMVIARVEDPTVNGPNVWDHALTDQLIHTRVIQGVATNATDIPANLTYSAIPLARINIPANTATITQDMITDLRPMLNPRQDTVSLVQRGGTQSNGEWDEAGNITDTYERWPQHQWRMLVPSWARYMQMSARWSQTFLKANNGTSGIYDARGLLRVRLFNDSAELLTTPGSYNVNQTSPTNGQRVSTIEVGQEPRSVPAALRGTNVTVQMLCQGTAGQLGRLVADNYASFFIDFTFSEQPLPTAVL